MLACAAGAWAATAAALPVRLVVGNEVWQPGRAYRAGDDWLGLVCRSTSECELRPARLAVRASSWQGHYDDQPTRGQTLSFHWTDAAAAGPPAAAKVWFQRSASHAWLRPGPVVGHNVARRSDSPGTQELSISAPDGTQHHLLPLLQLGADTEGSPIHLQLRSASARQLLDGTLSDCGSPVSPAYLVWAGDLDRDGRSDVVVSFVDADGPVHLYLSGARQGAQLVALAGTFEAPPFGGECDGGPWYQPWSARP